MLLEVMDLLHKILVLHERVFKFLLEILECIVVESSKHPWLLQ